MTDTFMVLAHYANTHRGSIVLGHFQTYEEALECLNSIEDYMNVQVFNIFTGGAIYVVPKHPIPKERFQYMDLKFTEERGEISGA